MRTSAAPRLWIFGVATALALLLGAALLALGWPVPAALVAMGALAAQAAAVRHLAAVQAQQLRQQREATQAAEQQLAAQREAAVHSRTEFISGMGHELRTPLNAILGYTELIKRGANLSQRQLEGLATVEHSGLKLLALINDLLDLAKLEAGKLELHPEPIRLADFAQEVGQTARGQSGSGHLGLAIEATAELPQAVLVDSHRLRQVLLYLLGHALQSADSGQVVLRVGSRALDDGRALLVFDVQDMGLGLDTPPAESFQALQPAEGAPHRTGGAELGLRMSQALVHLMQGDIRVAGAAGPGAVWRLELPVPVVHAAPEAADTPLDVVGYLGPRKSILIVDDVEMYRSLLAGLLGGLGFDLDEAADGQSCLDRVAARTPDLILMDLVMPVMDGLEAIRCIRMQAQWQDIPIVVISANCSERDRLRSLGAGAQAVMGKPIEPPELLATVGKQLGLSWITGPAGEEGGQALPPAPPPEQLAMLHQLALEGNMRKVRQFAEDLAGLGEPHQALAAQLRRMACDYQSRAILELVEQYVAREGSK